MKLDRKVLKKLIVETLNEAEDPRDEMTGTAHSDVRAGMESEPQPKDFGQADEVGDAVADLLNQVASAYEENRRAMEKMEKLYQEMQVKLKELGFKK